MFYIHQACSISPQQTFSGLGIDFLVESKENKLKVIEPSYENVPKNILRRMGKTVRIGVGAALPLIKATSKIDGIIMGTANGGMEESVLFLNQIIKFNEGILTPGNFVQSTSNAIAAQIGLLSSNKGYNITHVHGGLAFENAAIDAAMLLIENKSNYYLLGGTDEIGSYNYKFDYLSGWYKNELISNKNLYECNSPGTIAGEGSSMFLINNETQNSIAKVEAIKTIHTEDEEKVRDQLQHFIKANIGEEEKIDLFLSGENGDNRLQHFYSSCESLIKNETAVARFKHMCGEYPTASSFALWLACKLLESQILPVHMVKRSTTKAELKRIIIYNNYKGSQHSFILVSKLN